MPIGSVIKNVHHGNKSVYDNAVNEKIIKATEIRRIPQHNQLIFYSLFLCVYGSIKAEYTNIARDIAPAM